MTSSWKVSKTAQVILKLLDTLLDPVIKFCDAWCGRSCIVQRLRNSECTKWCRANLQWAHGPWTSSNGVRSASMRYGAWSQRTVQFCRTNNIIISRQRQASAMPLLLLSNCETGREKYRFNERTPEQRRGREEGEGSLRRTGRAHLQLDFSESRVDSSVRSVVEDVGLLFWSCSWASGVEGLLTAGLEPPLLFSSTSAVILDLLCEGSSITACSALPVSPASPDLSVSTCRTFFSSMRVRVSFSILGHKFSRIWLRIGSLAWISEGTGFGAGCPSKLPSAGLWISLQANCIARRCVRLCL